MSHIRPHLVDKPHWVYRCYDADDNLLYVGCTHLQPPQRIVGVRVDHPRSQWERMVRWEAELFATGLEAEAAEGALIDELRPPMNRHRSGVTTRRSVVAGPPLDRASGAVPPTYEQRYPKRKVS